MGNITVSLEDKDELVLRRLASEKYKNKKGSLAKVIGESVTNLAGKGARNRAMARQFDLMEKGFDFGKTKEIKREEIYDRK
ncbi:MAG TPA: hypothetical protein VFF13_00860 [archaeon]|nr:hypothetical protein [archaeon]